MLLSGVCTMRLLSRTSLKLNAFSYKISGPTKQYERNGATYNYVHGLALSIYNR